MASPPQRQHTQTPTRPSAEPNRPGSQVEATKIIPLLNQLENVARQLLPYREKLPRVDEIWEKNAKLKQEASGLREENTTLTAAVTRAALTQEQYIQSSERERKGALAKQNETENKLQEVVKMNSGLRKELDSLKQRFVDKGEVAAAVEKERAKHEREMKSKMDKFGKEMKDAQAKLKAAEIKIKLVQDNLDKQQRLLTGTELNLESYRKELENTKKDLCIEELDKDLFVDDMENMATECHDLAMAHFGTDLREDYSPMDLMDLTRALNRSSLIKSIAPFEIPLSNSRVSKLMRAAAAEHVISSKICHTIFRQFNRHPREISDVLDSMLNEILGQGFRQEAVCRAVLNTACKSQSAERQLISFTAYAIVDELGLLLKISNDRQALEKFQSALQKLIHKAVAAWEPALKSTVRLLASTDAISNEGWDSWDHYDEEFALMESQRLHSPSDRQCSLVLFPHICLQQNINTILCRGIAITSDRLLAVASSIEANEIAKSLPPESPTIRGSIGRGGGKPRRGSIKNDRLLSINGVLPTQQAGVTENGDGPTQTGIPQT